METQQKEKEEGKKNKKKSRWEAEKFELNHLAK